MFIKLLALTVLLFSSGLFARSEWLFPMPLYYGDRVIGEVNVFTDGEKFNGVPASDLLQVIEPIINEDIANKLRQYKSQRVTAEVLNPLSIFLEFDPLKLSLKASLSKDSAEENRLEFGVPVTSGSYSRSTFFAWHNIFNLTYDADLDSDGGELDNWLGEWIASGNIGGPQGVNFEFSGFIENTIDQSELSDYDLFRGDARVFVDQPSVAVRYSLGDVTSRGVGHMPSINVGGLAIERRWGDLQPDRNIQNGGSQSIFLRESGEVFIYINDEFYTQVRLSPGRYQIDDIPLNDGINDITIEIVYLSGRREVINYTQFYNTRILREGISDFALFAGYISNIEDNKYSYDEEQLVGQVFYDYGLTDSLTVGLNSTYHPDGQIAGTIINLATEFGTFANRLSGLAYNDSDEIGYIYSLDYEHSIVGNLDYTSPNFRVSFNTFSEYRPTPWILTQELQTGIRVSSRYNYYLLNILSYQFNFDWKNFEDEEDTYTAGIEIRWDPWDFSFVSGIEYDFEADSLQNEVEYYFTASWSWISDSGDYYALLEYQTRNERARANFSRFADLTPNSFGYDLRADLTRDTQDYSARLDYIANRFTAEVEYNEIVDDDISSQIVSGRASTSISLIGGDLAWGRSYLGPAAVVSVHDTLDVPVLINGVPGEPEQTASRALSGLVPLNSPHSESIMYIDVPDAPVGYDYGRPRREFVAGTYTGHRVLVGSDASYTVIGQLLIPGGNPLVLRNGTLIGESGETVFFTNSAGRFAIEGIAPGRYRIEIRGRPFYVGEMVVDSDKSNLVYLDPIVIFEESR